MDDEEKEDGERVSLVILSLPSRRWDTLEERFDLSPLCPANKRDNFSNLNRTPFESTGWNELEEHHYVKQIYPRARRGVTWFRWKKKGEFFVFGRGRKIFLVFILFLSNPSYSLSKFEEVWEDLRGFKDMRVICRFELAVLFCDGGWKWNDAGFGKKSNVGRSLSFERGRK